MISIQILRGIAAMLVIIFHITQKLYVNGDISWSFDFGTAGVDIFFIISGFIIHYSSINELSANSFIKKRLIRIFPLYWLITFATFVIYLTKPELINQHADYPVSLWQSFTLFPIANKSFLLVVAWSLSYEILFYLVYYIAIQIKTYRILFSSACLVGLIFIGQKINNEFLNNPILLEFIFGMIISYLVISKNVKSVLIITIATIALSATPIVWDSQIRSIHFGIPALALFCSFLLLEKNFKKEYSIVRLAQIIGDSSYSIYLTHLYSLGIIFILLKPRAPLIVTVVMAFIASVIGGILCYKIVEKRIMRYLKPLAKKTPIKDVV